MKKLAVPVAILFGSFFVLPFAGVANAETNLPITLAQYYGGDNSGDYHPHHEYHQQYHQSCHKVCAKQDYYGHCIYYRTYCD